MSKIRIVAMVPVVVETDFPLHPAHLSSWARDEVAKRFPEGVDTAHDSGPIDGKYYAKLVECVMLDKTEHNPLDDIVAPGLVA